MNPFAGVLVIFGAAFLLGSAPWGYLAGRARGLDIRRHGSGNIGATNVFRVMGPGWGVAVFALDFLKGLAAALGGGLFAAEAGLPGDVASVAGGLGAILGHNFTPWLGFKGGKGIASSAGVLFGITPVAAAAALALWVVLFFSTRYVSVASIGAAVGLPVFTAVIPLLPGSLPGGTPLLLGFSVVIGALAVWRHAPNIRRLLAGTEPRFGGKKRKL